MNDQDLQKLGEWFRSHKTGVSSETMAAIAMGAKVGRFDAPYDPSDFGRCYGLVQQVPAIRNYFDQIAELVPVFSGILREFDVLCDLYDRDYSSGCSQELYDRIKELRKESKK